MKRESLDGTIPDERRLAAYCRLHKVSLTVRQIKAKKCLQKRCYHLSKYKQHPYWEQRELWKAKKKADKKARKEKYNV